MPNRAFFFLSRILRLPIGKRFTRNRTRRVDAIGRLDLGRRSRVCTVDQIRFATGAFRTVRGPLVRFDGRAVVAIGLASTVGPHSTRALERFVRLRQEYAERSPRAT